MLDHVQIHFVVCLSQSIILLLLFPERVMCLACP